MTAQENRLSLLVAGSVNMDLDFSLPHGLEILDG